jgi:hypothetical protein
LKSKVTVAPSIEPVTLAEVKEHLRITASNEDTLISTYIEAARQMAEDVTGRKFITQTLVGYVDTLGSGSVHGNWWSGTQTGTYFTHILNGKAFIELDWTPCSSITSIYTVDDDATETLYASTNYYLDNYDNDIQSRIRLTENAEIPTGLRHENAVKVTYVAGYGATAASVPMKLRHAIKMMAAELYNKRGDCDDCAMSAGQMPVLNQYKIQRL